MFNKKGLVSITTFSLLILLFISIVSLSYFFYTNSKTNFETQINEKEIIQSLHKLRSELIYVSSNTNSSLNYSDSYADENLIVQLDSSNITGIIREKSYAAQKTISLYGLEFCSSKNVSLVINTTYMFNGTCINVS